MKEMTPPFAPEPKFFEHPRYAEFLVTLGNTVGDWNLVNSNFQKQIAFYAWLADQERAEDAEDFKNLVPMHIRMNTEEWNWFKAKIDAEDAETSLPNLKALAKHPPKSFKDLD